MSITCGHAPSKTRRSVLPCGSPDEFPVVKGDGAWPHVGRLGLNVAGFESRRCAACARLAQWIEQGRSMATVGGSSPSAGIDGACGGDRPATCGQWCKPDLPVSRVRQERVIEPCGAVGLDSRDRPTGQVSRPRKHLSRFRSGHAPSPFTSTRPHPASAGRGCFFASPVAEPPSRGTERRIVKSVDTREPQPVKLQAG